MAEKKMKNRFEWSPIFGIAMQLEVTLQSNQSSRLVFLSNIENRRRIKHLHKGKRWQFEEDKDGHSFEGGRHKFFPLFIP